MTAFIGWDEVSGTFLTRLASNRHLPISASEVARIMGMSQQHLMVASSKNLISSLP
jgi:hypothetical protein